MTKKAYALFLSDLHVGGFRSVFPPGFPVKAGPSDKDRQVWPLTLGQKYLYSCFSDMTRRVLCISKGRLVLFVNGDAIQGHRDHFATMLCAPELTDQVDACAKLLNPLTRKAVAIFISMGTKFHNSFFTEHEKELAHKLGGKYAYMHNVQILNKTINILHGRSSVQDYPSTPLEREIGDGIIKAALKLAPKADIIVRSHIHPDSFSPLVRYGKIAFFTPCWHLADEYVTTGLARYYRKIPLIGAVLAEITEEPMPHGVRLIPLTYPPPKEDLEVETVKW